MSIFLTVIHVIVCFVLILVILLQAGRGQGLTGPSFSSGNVQSLFGTGAGDFLTKATTVSAICFLFTCIGLGYIESHRSKSLLNFNQKASQLDMDAIKKALERVKNEEAPKAGDAVTKAAEQVKAEATKAASEVKTAAATATTEVKKAADAVKAEAAKVEVPALPKKS